ncbi:AMP-binding enzyme family protein [Mycobacterium xenopi 3993]|nr:AMP-binding enzyme family protein [Mycobacterium xenopi 3993]
MTGYLGDDQPATAGRYYRTGDVARRDAGGDITYIGRSDDVFKSSDYKVSPFELESVLVEHPAVVEAAVVPSPTTRGCRFRRPTSCWPPTGTPTRTPHERSWSTCATASRRI